MFNRLFSALKNTRESISQAFRGISAGNITGEQLDNIEEQLFLADIGYDTVENIIKIIKKFKNDDFLAEVKKYLITELPQKQNLQKTNSGPILIMIVGVNGTGKTTSVAKLAKLYKDMGSSVTLVAADTYRAAAVEQLQIWGSKIDVPVIAQQTGADSASVVFDAIQSAKTKGIDLVIADTAGRLHNKSNLMEELSKIKRVASKLSDEAPHEVLLVLDAATGQNAISQMTEFYKAVNVTGLVLTKLDGTAKGGILVSLAKKFPVAIRYIGIGEGINDLKRFDAETFVDALVDFESS